jgi:hypothetical protein
MLLMHGPTDNGVHLFWLDANGFTKAAYYPADRGTAYAIALEAETLVVKVVVQGKNAEHAMLWWGP